MVLCQIPTISPSNPGLGEWGMPLIGALAVCTEFVWLVIHSAVACITVQCSTIWPQYSNKYNKDDFLSEDHVLLVILLLYKTF